MTPLGMESEAIQDSQISASSQYNSGYAAKHGRLHLPAGSGNAGSWTAGLGDSNRWLQVDLGSLVSVAGIATQGRNGNSQWVKTYKLQYGEDDQNFAFYRRSGDISDTVRN